jgi:hypothetical protein
VVVNNHSYWRIYLVIPCRAALELCWRKPLLLPTSAGTVGFHVITTYRFPMANIYKTLTIPSNIHLANLWVRPAGILWQGQSRFKIYEWKTPTSIYIDTVIYSESWLRVRPHNIRRNTNLTIRDRKNRKKINEWVCRSHAIIVQTKVQKCK